MIAHDLQLCHDTAIQILTAIQDTDYKTVHYDKLVPVIRSNDDSEAIASIKKMSGRTLSQ